MKLVVFGAALLLGCGGSNLVVSQNAVAPSGKRMARVFCPNGLEECRDAANDECGDYGFRSETAWDKPLKLWFRCLPELRGNVQATSDPEGRKAWTDTCTSRSDCLADAGGVCPEGYLIEDMGSESKAEYVPTAFDHCGTNQSCQTGYNLGMVLRGKRSGFHASTDTTILFRCKDD